MEPLLAANYKTIMTFLVRRYFLLLLLHFRYFFRPSVFSRHLSALVGKSASLTGDTGRRGRGTGS